MMRFVSYQNIWGIEPGDELVAKQSLTMSAEDTYPHGTQVLFTEGSHYLVRSMHPMASPPFVLVVDDTGHENRIEPDFVRNFRHVANGSGALTDRKGGLTMSNSDRVTSFDHKRLAAGAFTTAGELKNKAASTKRAATSLRGILKDISPDLSLDDRDMLDGTLAMLDRIAKAYEVAHRVRKSSDTVRRDRYGDAMVIAKRIWGGIDSVEGKVAFIAGMEPWSLDFILTELQSREGTALAARKAIASLDTCFCSALEMAALMFSEKENMEGHAQELATQMESRRAELERKHEPVIAAFKRAIG